MKELGDRINVSSFYIAFVLSPLASNASELIASYNYAQKKTSKTIAISLATLQGAACLNNTFCLGK
jgi:Ca2+/Na+ antiporter